MLYVVIADIQKTFNNNTDVVPILCSADSTAFYAVIAYNQLKLYGSFWHYSETGNIFLNEYNSTKK